MNVGFMPDTSYLIHFWTIVHCFTATANSVFGYYIDRLRKTY